MDYTVCRSLKYHYDFDDCTASEDTVKFSVPQALQNCVSQDAQGIDNYAHDSMNRQVPKEAQYLSQDCIRLHQCQLQDVKRAWNADQASGALH